MDVRPYPQYFEENERLFGISVKDEYREPISLTIEIKTTW
ncbi:MAG: hypothetical protein SCAL_000229 [Candidatus Syntrophoarchaeum caldarius]|uniref:Uncharacterized protein n=1 Tax=Candidatus Syntropharchaeum caldarium TaxID=1838285 RepID=A0A1F2PBD2_9EURY|nr:MAG: hypothetical protein SCAL_000229 [Candidatus Syntrophoarchaeum caldarius]